MSLISTVIIAKNEADRIARTIISALPVSDEVLVLDTGSTDDTISVSQQAGARVISVEWMGYGLTKNIGIQLAKNDWILSLDADEVLSQELQEEIRATPLEKGNVYLLNRIVQFENQWVRHSGWHPDWVYRLFLKTECTWNDRLVHERLIVPNEVTKRRLNGLLEHYSYRSVDHFRAKIDEYALLTARQWINTKTRPTLLKRYFGKSWKYFNMYYLKQGYKDGAVGQLIASIQSDGVKKKIKYFDQLQSTNAK